MTRLGKPKYAPYYDLFKLIVAVILVIILIALLLRDRQQLPMQPLATLTRSIETAAATPLPPGTSTFKAPLITASATTTPLLSATSTPEIQPTVTLTTATSDQLSTSPPKAQPESTESVPTSDPNACPSAPTRIQVGDTVRVLYRLNFRVHPGLSSPIILTNGPGTLMDIIGGPVCTLKNTTEGPRAYLWWNVRMEDDHEGWSAESPLVLTDYFLEPVR